MTNIQMTLLSLYSRHPNYLLKLLYRYYPLSNEIIEKFKNEINWGVISSNQTRKWDQSFIEKFADKLNWDSMSANPKYIIDKNLSSVHGWQPHQYNAWADEFLLENAAILPWEFLCSDPNISWSEKLIDQLSPFWNKLEKESSDYTVSPWKGLSANPSVPWTWKLIEKYKKTLLNTFGLDWGELSRNTNLPWQDENLLEIYKDKWNWKLLSVNNGVGFTEEQIEKYQGLLTWDSGSGSNQNIASNTNLKWSSDFIEKYKQKWHWWSLSRNPGVNWTEEMICEFEGNIIWESMAVNSNLPWSLNFILKHEENLFKSWTITNSEFDCHIWNEVFKPIITDDLAKQILYNSSNPFQAIKSYIPEVDNTNIAQKNLEILTNLILKIDSQTNPYITNLTKIDLFLSSIQTAMTQILMVDENELKIDLKLLTELHQESDEATKYHLNALCSQVYEEIRVLFVEYGIQKIAQEVVLKQNEMNENYMGFSRQGGHLSQDYSFLHSFIKNYGKRHLELARLWVKLETLIKPS